MNLTQNQKQSAFVLALMLAGIAYMTLSGGAPGTPEAAVTQAVKELVEGVEKKDLGPFREHLSEEVRDERDRSKDEIINILRGIFFRYQKISLSIINLEAEDSANPDMMTAELTLLMGSSAIPEDKGNFILTFRREGDKWRVWQVNWEDGAAYGM